MKNITGVLLAIFALAGCGGSELDGAGIPPLPQDPPPVPEQPTFAADVAPIIFERCAPCHNPAGPAPFPLLNYRDAALRAVRIAEVTRTRFMPRWLPEPGYGKFLHERRLTEREIEIIQRWTTTDAPQGDPAIQPPPPQFNKDWRLGEPDLVASMPEAYVVPAKGRDIFRNLVISIPATTTRWIRAVELRPSNPKLIHHATMWIDRTATSRRIDAETPEPGYPSMDPRGVATDPDGQFLGWTPGTEPFAGRNGIAWRLDPGTDLVLQVHVLQPTGQPEPLHAEVGFYFADTPPDRFPFILHLGSKTLDIPAGERSYVVEDNYRLPVPVSVLALRPHAHYLGKHIEVWAELPDGEQRWLLKMPWDFSWQEEYQYEEPVPLPAGSTLRLRYVYDNSTDNPFNPNDPPQRVRQGPNSTDEMADLWLQVLPDNPRQLQLLAQDFMQKERALLIAGHKFAIANTDNPAPAHVDLALVLAAEGRRKEARKHLEQALALRPNYATAYNNLGTMLAEDGDLTGATSQFRQTLEIDPDFYEAHYNLGALLLAAGDLDGAEAHLHRGLELNPGSSNAQTDLGTVHFRRGAFEQARERFSRAFDLQPDNIRALYNLGLTEAQLGELARAADHFREVLEMAPGLVEAHVSLGHVALRTGTPKEAATHFQHALALAPNNPEAQQGLAQALKVRD
ncbi:MAG TPA: tetratricopeptide repeat protein [Rhodothermales bacterium]|nr:tetratricopeptide repeat protein [Rhodothermales bacterium]